jgi:CheY-like chemotaxis protein
LTLDDSIALLDYDIRFHFFLPADDAELQAQDPHTRFDRIEKLRQKRCRVLLVDDESVFRKSLATKFEIVYGAIVTEASTGISALEKTSMDPFDLILMDVFMPPGPTGVETCRTMREAGVRALIVLMSAYYTTADHQSAEALGVTLLNKPIDDALIEQILLNC